MGSEKLRGFKRETGTPGSRLTGFTAMMPFLLGKWHLLQTRADVLGVALRFRWAPVRVCTACPDSLNLHCLIIE